MLLVDNIHEIRKEKENNFLNDSWKLSSPEFRNNVCFKRTYSTFHIHLLCLHTTTLLLFLKWIIVDFQKLWCNNGIRAHNIVLRCTKHHRVYVDVKFMPYLCISMYKCQGLNFHAAYFYRTPPWIHVRTIYFNVDLI